MSEAPVTPANVQVPADPEAPVIVNFVAHALRVGITATGHVGSLPAKDWDVPGIYILVGALSGEPTDVYVGKATSLRRRLSQHRSNSKLDWWRAVAVARDTRDGFNSAEAGYLEGRLTRQLASLPGISPVVGQKDIDETLPSHLLSDLDAFVPTILAALRIVGLDTVRVAEQGDEGEVKQAERASYSVRISDLVAAGLLRPGEKLIFDQRGEKAEASVNAAGEIVLDGVAYWSPSGAGSEVLGGKAVNGWDAWTLGENGPLLSDLRARYQQDKENP